ncbi:MAG: helix-turn-helix domain-containing protein [Cyclobacteriaceae bacterium]|nr:helix-turn-helix domain-containing protein [Cyclobacteriaceae bacterium]
MKTIPIRSIKPHEAKADLFEGFKIRNLADVLEGKDLHQDLHRHDFYLILAVRKGKGSHEIDFVNYPVSDDSIFFMRPGQVHRIHLKKGTEGYLLEFNKGFQFLASKNGNELLRKAATKNYCKLDPAGDGKLAAILQAILEEYNARQEGFEAIIKANFEIFLIQFLRNRQNRQLPSVNADPYRQEKLEKFMHLLEVNVGTKKQVAAYAEMLSLSPYQLNSITRSLVGKTAAELIEDQLLLEARRFLLATPNQVNQVAYHLGFEDVSYFIRFFKKLTGYTPEAFRKNFQ